MARWRLKAKHYLPVPGTEWEQKETDRNTGKQVRKVYTVPLYLDPDDPADWTDKANQEIVVSDGDHAQPRDIIFSGEPTPDMEPVDEAAEAISDSLKHKWIHPIESLDGQGNSYGDSLLRGLEEQVARLMANQPEKPVSVGAIDTQAFAALQAQVAQLMEQNAQLQAKAAEPAMRRA